MHIYLEIETIPGQRPGLKEAIAAGISPPGSMKKAETIAKWEQEEKPAAIEDKWRRTAFDGDRGEVVCIGWAVNHQPSQVLAREPGESEGALLATWFGEIQEALRAAHGRLPTWIGHNVREFDLRFLFQRAVVLEVPPPFRLPHDVRPGAECVFDTMTAWSGWGGRVSLDRLCEALGIPGKGSEIGVEIDGSKVWDFVRDGRLDLVAEYCRADVERVRAIHRRLTFAGHGLAAEVAA